jgi:hypothetical protein
MSADNGVYILETKDKFKRIGENSWKNMFGKDIVAYRVAHAVSIDNFEWYKENELHNLGLWMNEMFGESPIFYNKEEARKYAFKKHDDLGYTEYGVCDIDASEYNFPGS